MTAPCPDAERTPKIGDVVLYRLTPLDVSLIVQNRNLRSGVTGQRGNDVHAEDVYPMIIARVWGDTPSSHVNGQVILDGPDTYWATSRSAGDAQGQFTWSASA